MTAETRTTIELKDIVGVEFECPECHTRTLKPLRDDNAVPLQCHSGYCVKTPKVFFASENSSEYQELRQLLNLLWRYAQNRGNGNEDKQSLKLRLEIKTA